MIYLRAIDVSAYQQNVPWDALNTNGVCDVAIIKGGQGQTTREHVNQARAKGIKYIILYFWQDPTIAAFYQILVISNDIKEFQPIAAFLDSEQWWGNWDQYWQFLAGKLSLSQMTILSPQTISNHGLAVLNGVQKNFPALPLGDYTARWFTEGWAQPMDQWLVNFILWVANYIDYGQTTYKVTYDYIKTQPPDTIQPVLPTGLVKWLIWQFSSRMIYPGQSYPYDTNVIKKEEFLTLIGENTMPAAIYNQNVVQKDRAKILLLSAGQAHSDIPAIAKSTDALLLAMGGMSGTDIYEESGFVIRTNQASQAGLPVLAQFNVSALYYLNKGTPLATVQNLSTADNNLPVQKLLDILSKSGPVHALVLSLTDYQTSSGDITDVWQQSTLQSVLYPLTGMMSKGTLKRMPIIVLSYPAFLTKYNQQLLNFLYNRRGEISIGLHQWISNGEPWMTLSNLQTLWDTYRPPDTFKYISIPYGYQGETGDGHVVFHVFTDNHFIVPEVTYSDGASARVSCALWCDTREELYEFLNFVPGSQPPPSDIQAQINALNASLTAMEVRIKALEDKMEFHKL